ncbi:MAG: hypothetical protein WBG14_00125 [Rhodococcus sp. (in: high G+C Gram-positive bacteria)]
MITNECPGLRFNGKYADVVALSTGDPTALRPQIDEETRRRVAEMPPHGWTRHWCSEPTDFWGLT